MIAMPCVDSAAKAPLGDGSWQISLPETISVDPVDNHCEVTSTTMLRAKWLLTIVESCFNTIRKNMSTYAILLSMISYNQPPSNFCQLIQRPTCRYQSVFGQGKVDCSAWPHLSLNFVLLTVAYATSPTFWVMGLIGISTRCTGGSANLVVVQDYGKHLLR